MATVLSAEGLCAGYGTVNVISDIDLTVDAGEVVALLGANGAGKTTTLRALAGVLAPRSGCINFSGARTTAPLHSRARNGLGYVSEDRSVFMGMTTMDNLKVGRGDVTAALDLFPELKSRLHVRAGLLSGGEQQMLTLARALSRSPRVLLVDEISLGLAPLASARLLRAVRAAADGGLGVVLVEQYVRTALEVADRGYVMRRGRIEISGTAADLSEQRERIEQSYLAGVA